jgi:hypothetical protein
MKLIPSIPPGGTAGANIVQCDICHRTTLARQISTRKVGIRIRESWYCSAPCFTTAAEKEISRILTSATDQPGHVPRMPLGLNLVRRGFLTVEQLKRATDEQKDTNEDIGEFLVRCGAISEKQLTAVRAADWGCPVFNLPKHSPPVGKSLPQALIRRFLMIPVHYVSATNLLLVGFVRHVEYGLLYAVEQMTECQTKPCFLTASDFELKLQQSAPSRELTFEDTHSVAEMARLLCVHGLDLEADEALIENGRDYVWARLKADSGTLDLLFRTT